jgi:hypothetical protein
MMVLVQFAIVLALASAGCNVVFPLRDKADAGIDAEASDGPSQLDAPGCDDEAIDEDFNAPVGNPCGDGEEIGQGVSRQSGQLVIVPPPGPGLTGACHTTMAIPFEAVSVEVPAVPTTDGMFAALILQDVDNTVAIVAVRKSGVTTVGIRLNGDNGVNDVGYDAVEHRYWRLRTNGNTTDSEVSADGDLYKPLFTGMLPAMQNVTITLTAGAIPNANVTAPTEARFDNLEGCPD